MVRLGDKWDKLIDEGVDGWTDGVNGKIEVQTDRPKDGWIDWRGKRIDRGVVECAETAHCPADICKAR